MFHTGSKFLRTRLSVKMSSSTIDRAKTVYKIASVPADGIGPEVISAGIQVLQKLAAVIGTFEFDFDHVNWGSDYYKQHGTYIPEGGVESLKKYDAIFFGSVGAPGTPSLQNHHKTLTPSRRPRPHLPLVPPPRYMPRPSTVRQYPPNQDPPRHRIPAQRLPARGSRLGDRPGKLRRRIRRARRPYTHRAPVGSRHRSRHLYAPRRRAADALRFRHGPETPAEKNHSGDKK